jgi:hypothetical protein
MNDLIISKGDLKRCIPVTFRHREVSFLMHDDSAGNPFKDGRLIPVVLDTKKYSLVLWNENAFEKGVMEFLVSFIHNGYETLRSVYLTETDEQRRFLFEKFGEGEQVTKPRYYVAYGDYDLDNRTGYMETYLDALHVAIRLWGGYSSVQIVEANVKCGCHGEVEETIEVIDVF